MKAVILAGGLGTRLRPLTYTRPKVMLPIMNKPILHYVIDSLAKQGFEEIIITTSYMHKLIQDHFKDGEEYGIKILYSIERKPLGTAGGVKKASKYLNETFAVIQGDNITEINFKKEMEFHKKKEAFITIALKSIKEPWLYGIAELDKEKRIVRFLEKPKPEECFSNLASTGLYILEPEVLDHIPKNVSYDFAKDLFPKLLKEGYPIYGFETDAFWTDIGSPLGYLEAIQWILSNVKKKISNNAEVRGEIRGNVYIEDFALVKQDAKVRGPAFIGREVEIERGTSVLPYSFINDGSRIGKFSYIERSVIYERVNSKENVVMEKCIVGEDCKIGKKVNVEEMAVIGPNCEIGNEVKVCKGSRIWPGLKVNSKSIVSGVIRRARR